MWKNYLKIALLCGISLTHANTVSGQTPSVPMEVGGTLQKWKPGSGYLVVNGNRYHMDMDTVVISQAGEPLSTGSVRSGLQVLVNGSNDRASRITVFPMGADLPQR
ncbi:MAG: hypothetical protein ABR553_09170 [Gammaproteobacteria bacterium]